MVEYPELVFLERQFDDRGLRVVGVLHQDSPSYALEYTDGLEGSTYTTVVDENGTTARAYQLFGVPLTVIIDPTGIMIDRMLGWYSGKGDELRVRLDRLLPQLNQSDA